MRATTYLSGIDFRSKISCLRKAEGMKLEWLEDFLALAREGNFTRAAELRRIAQPAFSRRIQMLEQWVGVTLVDREQQPVQLTDMGRLFLPTAESATSQLYLGRENVQQAHRGRGTLRFAATHTISILFFPQWLQTIVPPEAELSLRLESNHMSTCARLLTQNLCEFMLCYTHADADLGFDQNRYDSKVIAHDRLVPVSAATPSGSPLHQLPGCKSKSVPFLHFSEASALGQIIDAMLLRRKDAKFITKTSSSPLAAALKSMAESGLGVTWIAALLAGAALKDGTLTCAGGKEWEIPVEIKIFRANGSFSQVADEFWSAVPTPSYIG
jgi:DNA-binding transcriptional LysR family regulator